MLVGKLEPYNLGMVKEFGRSGAIFLAQLDKLLLKDEDIIERDERRWVLKTAKEWQQEIGFASGSIPRIVKNLHYYGVLLVKRAHIKKYINCYSIDYDLLEKSFYFCKNT